MTAKQPDDPTRALDDFVARLHPDRVAAARDAADGANGTPRPGGGVLRNGQRWRSDDVEDATVVVPPDPQLDTEGLAAGLARASASATAQFDALAADARAPAPQPDLHNLGLVPRGHPRLREYWSPDAWVVAGRALADATTEVVQTRDGPVVETYPAVQLVALWAPLARADAALPRYPQRLMLAVADRDAASRLLLRHLPGDAPLWWPRKPGADIDWALLAELAQLHLARLRPAQQAALKQIQQLDREATFARLNDGFVLDETHGAIVRR